MNRAVATTLVAFAGLMLIVFGIATGVGEQLLEPRGITENAYTSERNPDREVVATDSSALSCGTPWVPFDRAPDEDSPEAEHTESELSSFGVERCDALMAGEGLNAGLLTATGAGIWVILMVGGFLQWERRRSEIRLAEEEAEARRWRAERPTVKTGGAERSASD